jgi:predicted TIM-barrel fold metal-dependent hydrolase
MIRAAMNSSEGRCIIDAHFHLWRYDSGEYGWISEDMAVLRRDYLPANLLEEFHAMECSAVSPCRLAKLLRRRSG